MDGRIYQLKRHPLVWAILLSILFHFLFLIFLFQVQNIQIGIKGNSPLEKNARDPLVFQIIESPDQSETPPDQANLYSDKQSLARDMQAGGEGNTPFSESGVEFQSLPQQEQEDQQAPEEMQEPPVDEQSMQLADKSRKPAPVNKSQKKFDKQMLVNNRVASNQVNQPAYKQTRESANDFGGISFNTYAWDYAPYLLELKKRIQKNIYPPPAFTHLGFGGVNQIRFRIMPDGQLVGPFLVNASGEEALIETSKKAVEISAPFPPLPDDFPEKYLEVNAQFSYTTYNMNQ